VDEYNVTEELTCRKLMFFSNLQHHANVTAICPVGRQARFRIRLFRYSSLFLTTTCDNSHSSINFQSRRARLWAWFCVRRIGRLTWIKAPYFHSGLVNEVGTKASPFTLKDQNGKDRSLDEFLKKGKVAQVFYRSGRLVTVLPEQLGQLQADLKKIEATGTQVIAISYDSVEVLASALPIRRYKPAYQS
jgi:hypothetical protein